MPQKNPAKHVGGPGAAHENRKHPEKSKPHGELPHDDASAGNVATRIQHESMGGDHRPSHQAPEARGHSNVGHTGKKDDPVKPKSRRQVR
jgi:hypothetical protein